MKYVIGILIGIALNLWVALGNMDILLMLILPILNMVSTSTYFYLFQFFSSVSYNFPNTGLLHPWLGLFLGILLFLKQLQMGLFS